MLFKSDVQGAYHLIPAHPLWQIKQVVTTNYPTKEEVALGINRGPLVRRVDWQATFGSCGSPRLWASVMGLILWILIHAMFVINLFAYVDNNFGFETAGNLEWYKPYNQFMPAAQVTLLTLWDYLSVPYEYHKQLWREELTIIGFLIDINQMTLTLPVESKDELITAINDFLQTTSRRRSLAQWLQLAGWISWSLNVFPLLRPALCNVYLKTSGKEDKWCEIYINKASVVTDRSVTQMTDPGQMGYNGQSNGILKSQRSVGSVG